MTDPTPAAPPPLIPVGAHVTSRHSPEWGTGVVMSRDGKHVRVLFFAHPAKKPVAVSAASLVVGRVGTWPDPNKIPATSHGTSKSGGKKKAAKKLAAPSRTREEALQAFLAKFPGAFADPAYLKEERDPKWAAHELFEQLLGAAELKRLVEAGDAKELTERALKVEAASPDLLHRIEKARLRAAFADEAPALDYFRALAALLEAADVEAAFPGYVKALEGLQGEGTRVAIWTLTTLLPHLARPDVFLFVKPTPTKEAAARYALDLRYSATPNLETFQQLRKLVAMLREDLDPHGCRDLIDVQSFVSRTLE